MKRVVSIAALLVIAGAVIAGTVTQQTNPIEARNIPRYKFYDQINTAVYSLITNDVKNIITEVNARETAATPDTLTIATALILPPDVHTSLTNAATVTPTSPYMQLPSSATAITCTVANASAAGQFLILENVAGTGTNIIFADSGNLNLSGATTLGPGDTLGLIATATNAWKELFQAGNN